MKFQAVQTVPRSYRKKRMFIKNLSYTHMQKTPPNLRVLNIWVRSCFAEVQSRIRSNRLVAALVCSRSVDRRNCFAPNLMASLRFDSEVEMTVTSAPMAAPYLTARCPNPPRPTTLTKTSFLFLEILGIYITYPIRVSLSTLC